MKADLGFLNAILAMFAPEGTEDDEESRIAFEEDVKHIRQSLKDDPSLSTTTGVRHFYDDLHISPLKVLAS